MNKYILWLYLHANEEFMGVWQCLSSFMISELVKGVTLPNGFVFGLMFFNSFMWFKHISQQIELGYALHL